MEGHAPSYPKYLGHGGLASLPIRFYHQARSRNLQGKLLASRPFYACNKTSGRGNHGQQIGLGDDASRRGNAR
jgi:hypothetical protein